MSTRRLLVACPDSHSEIDGAVRRDEIREPRDASNVIAIAYLPFLSIFIRPGAGGSPQAQAQQQEEQNGLGGFNSYGDKSGAPNCYTSTQMNGRCENCQPASNGAPASLASLQNELGNSLMTVTLEGATTTCIVAQGPAPDSYSQAGARWALCDLAHKRLTSWLENAGKWSQIYGCNFSPKC